VNDGNLGDVLRRHLDLVIHDRSGLPFVRKDIGDIRQESAARLHHGDAGQPVLPGEQLGASMLLRCHTEQRSTLDGGIVGNEHATAPADLSDTRDDRRARRHAVVHPLARQMAELEKRRAGVDQRRNTFARQQLAPRLVQGTRLDRAALTGLRPAFAQVIDPRQILRARLNSSEPVATADFIAAIIGSVSGQYGADGG